MGEDVICNDNYNYDQSDQEDLILLIYSKGSSIGSKITYTTPEPTNEPLYEFIKVN